MGRLEQHTRRVGVSVLAVLTALLLAVLLTGAAL